MKLALIPPMSLLSYTYKTDYQLMLPQLQSNARYSAVYKKHCSDQDTYVILDNGAAENVEMAIPVLANMASIYKVNELVIPDAMGDYEKNLERAHIFYEECVPPRNMPLLPFKLMFVVQGQTLMEVLKSGEWAASQPWIDTIGIPRHLLTTIGDNRIRIRVANILQGNGADKEIHFLGGSPLFPGEVGVLANPAMTNQAYVRGIDTSMPFNYAYAGSPVDRSEVIHRPERYFDLESTSFDMLLTDYNVEYFIKSARVNWGYR